ncbi:phosphatase PAP2 family protein [Candidatus Gracilibacteria bacterium]|nr:phosphatase PAP2 family protein [Candidatus Gracilibacteria bacterium]
MLQELNTNILKSLHSLLEYSFIENIVYIFADLPIFLLPIFLITAWIRYRKQESKKIDLLHIFYGCIVGIFISLVIQQFVDIARPESALTGSANLILNHIPDASFPSDHATVSVAFLTGLFLAGYKKLGYVFLVLTVIMNLSRVIAGVHWPFDILAGAIVGIIASLLSFRALNKIGFVKQINLFIIKISGLLKL